MDNNSVSIECEFIALSDEFSLGQFGKINLLGLNPGEILSIPQLPYWLISTIVIQGVMCGKGAPQNISLGITYKDQQGSISFSNTVHYPPIISNNSKTPLSLVLPFKCYLTNYGILECILLANGSRIKTKAFRVASGIGPSVNSSDLLTSSGTIHESTGFEIKALLKSANISLTIIDQYLKPKELMNLITTVPNTSEVKVLTNPNLQKSYENAFKESSNLQPFPQVRFSKKIHDRYVIVNSSEYYHFGHSLKDLSNGRASRYSKLYLLDEIVNFSKLFETEWENSRKMHEE